MSYTYDANGNMTHDGMRGVDLEYNSLNLVSKVKQGNTANATYRWLADGTKAGVTDNEGNGFEYLGSFVYQRDVNGLNLESTSFGAGRFVASSTGEMTPYYHITDHLGSVRVVYDSPNAVLAHNDYYAFGLKHENPNLANHTSNRYLYNGKEEQTTGAVNLLDYGARMYDATLGRWHSVDPMATNYTNYSPYVYCANNPIRMIDPNGMWFKDTAWEFVGELLDDIKKQQRFNNQQILYLQHLSRMFGTNSIMYDRMQRRIDKYMSNNAELGTTEMEIYMLALSNQMYDIIFDETINTDTDYRGKFGFNFETGIAEIRLGVLATHMLAHEMKHAYQFEIGALSVPNGRAPLLLHDQDDEFNAYKRGSWWST